MNRRDDGRRRRQDRQCHIHVNVKRALSHDDTQALPGPARPSPCSLPSRPRTAHRDNSQLAIVQQRMIPSIMIFACTQRQVTQLHAGWLVDGQLESSADESTTYLFPHDIGQSGDRLGWRAPSLSNALTELKRDSVLTLAHDIFSSHLGGSRPFPGVFNSLQ